MAEKVAIQSSGLAFLFPRYSLGKCSAFESYFIKKRKRWVFYRPASHFFFLASLKEMLGAESFFIKSRKRWVFYRPASHFFFLAIRSGNARRSNPTFTIKKRALRAHFFIMAEKVGFEPTCGCPQTLFESAPLRPLRYFSILISFFFLAVP